MQIGILSFLLSFIIMFYGIWKLNKTLGYGLKKIKEFNKQNTAANCYEHIANILLN